MRRIPEKQKICLTRTDLQQLEALYKNSEELDNDRIPDVIEKLSSTISKLKDSLSKSSRTPRLWINYINYINIFKTFIRAERMCKWDFHLTAVANMIDPFAATGHIHYAKSACLYLQYTRPTKTISLGLVYGMILSKSRSLCELLKVEKGENVKVNKCKYYVDTYDASMC